MGSAGGYLYTGTQHQFGGLSFEDSPDPQPSAEPRDVSYVYSLNPSSDSLGNFSECHLNEELEWTISRFVESWAKSSTLLEAD